MAKRFTDTDKWRRPWFRKLEPRAKLAWLYLVDNCDHAGIWNADFDLLSFQLGIEIHESDLQSWFEEKLIKIDQDKFFIPSFLEFQYEVSPEAGRPKLNFGNKAHIGVIKALQKNGVSSDLWISSPFEAPTKPLARGLEAPTKPLGRGLEAPQEKEKEKEKEQEQEEGGVGETKPAAARGLDLLPEILADLRQTFEAFGIRKDPKLDEASVARLVQRYGFEKAQAAIIGARFEGKTDRFDPKTGFSVTRLLAKPEIFDKCVNLGFQNSKVSREVYNPETGKYEAVAS